MPNKGPESAPPKLRKFAGSAVAAKVNFGGHSAAAYPALSRIDIRGHSAAAKVTLATEAQPAKLRKVGGYHLGANDEHAAVLTPPKLRNIGGRRSGRQNSAQISGFARVATDNVLPNLKRRKQLGHQRAAPAPPRSAMHCCFCSRVSSALTALGGVTTSGGQQFGGGIKGDASPEGQGACQPPTAMSHAHTYVPT